MKYECPNCGEDFLDDYCETGLCSRECADEVALNKAHRELSTLRAQNAEQADRIRELEGKNDGFNELTGLMQKSLEEDTTRIGELSDENQQLRAALVRARDEFEHFTEYWNGDVNYQAMNNALNYIECKARKQVENIDAILSGQPVEDPRDAEIASLQAKIDALMLEYCPDEMTPEQMEEWASHQVVCEDPRDKSDCHGPDWTERDMEYLK